MGTRHHAADRPIDTRRLRTCRIGVARAGVWRVLPIMVVGLGLAGNATAADPVAVTMQGHRFQPDHLQVPAGERFQIVVENRDDTAGEFESYDMKVEKIVAPGSKITVHAGPLRAGSYSFFDDYHPDTAQGSLTAVEANPNSGAK